MSYTPGIPNATDLISQSQSQIKTNFQKIDSATNGFAVDHVTLTDNTDGGKHKKSTYIQQGSDPTPSAGEASVYTKAVGSRTELFYRGESSGPITELSSVKAWGSFNGSTGTLTDSMNVASVVRNSAGNYTVNFTDNLANANYAVLATGQITSAFTTGGIVGIDSRAVGSFSILVRSLTAASGVDLNPISFVVLGS